jgi:hypothetical protein
MDDGGHAPMAWEPTAGPCVLWSKSPGDDPLRCTGQGFRTALALECGYTG